MLTRSDLWSLEEYAERREVFRVEVLEHKKARRILLGDHILLMFEDQTTIKYQIQEMLRIEKVFEAIPNEEAKKEILNFTAGLSEKFSKQIDKVEKNLTPDQARKLYAAVARDLGKSQKEIQDTVSNLEENQVHLEERMRRELKKKDAADAAKETKE